MDQRSWGSRWWSQGLLALILAAGSGCLGFLHPVAPPAPELVAPCQALPKCCKDHVYVFFLNGCDLLNCGNLTGLRDFVQCLGFTKTYHGQLYHVWWFEKEICRLHREDPCAHFVLAGPGRGGSVLQDVARSALARGIWIDRVICLGGSPPEESPAVEGSLPPPLYLPGATDCGTPERLAQELMLVAATVPVEAPKPVAPPREEAPTPHPMKVRNVAPPTGWDFLSPVSRLKPVTY
jgi:hypothetical protein